VSINNPNTSLNYHITHTQSKMVGGIEIAALEEEHAAATTEKQSVIFILENANLETAKVGKNYELLNCDDHTSFLKRHKRDPALYRPDICHQALLAILDSPLNKAGRIKAVYVHTSKNVLISISPQVRLPRTFRRFCGLFVQLLQKLSIRATNGPDKLLRIVKGPVSRLLPPDALRIGFSHSAGEPQPMSKHINRWLSGKQQQEEDNDNNRPLVFFLGAFAHGKVDQSLADEYISISSYPLSAAYALGRITNALEQRWDIV
jgi:rRNA small subunit pseudouridine methyltransferase Nep1